MKKGLKFISFLLLISIALTSGGCSASEPAMPAFWQVTDSETGNKIYLLGSIHVAEASIYPMSDTIMHAYDSCDYLAVEVDMVKYLEDYDLQMAMSQYSLYTDGSSIYDDIDKKLVDKAIKILEDSDIDIGLDGLPITVLERFKPDVWISYLDNVAVNKAGLDSDKGVDQHFLSLAYEDNKTVFEIETVESQIKLLSGFSPELQKLRFESSLDIDDAADSILRLYEAWKVGDTFSILYGEQGTAAEQEITDEEILLYDEYEEQMGGDRNDLMSRTAEDYLLNGQQVFYVVGAMHMLGDTGIVYQLNALGYDVKRL